MTVVIPCLDEAVSIERCVATALTALEDAGISGEVVVADNGSHDDSRALAAAAGARVIYEPRRGYGSALRAGFAAAQGDYIVMADADLTYDFSEVPRFVERLRGGADMVIGDRMSNIDKGAMPFLHRYVGNPLLSRTLNLFFRAGVRDAHCGLRGFHRSLLRQLDLRTTGMELASEMVIRAVEENFIIDQVSIKYSAREGQSKLDTFGDGWRHLRFLLVHSPSYLFLVPGLVLGAIGLLLSLTVMLDLSLLGRNWQLHALVGGCLLLVVGTQVVGLGVCAHAYRAYFLGGRQPWFERLRQRVRLEQVLVAGGLVLAVGAGVCAYVVVQWIANDFGELREERLFIAAATLVMLGVQVIFTSFLVSILGLRRRVAEAAADPLDRLEQEILHPVEERAAAGA